uniref:Uncharacterized protein n=1 Tax=Laticauda laticaudata TaxID=8630 RepID=A0A8C5SVN8_LATLA
RQSLSTGSFNFIELPENWTDTRETLLEGMLFNLKYLGMTLVEQPKGEELSATAVKRIVATAKASGKKLRKVTLKVSPRGIVLSDSITNESIENVSIYRYASSIPFKFSEQIIKSSPSPESLRKVCRPKTSPILSLLFSACKACRSLPQVFGRPKKGLKLAENQLLGMHMRSEVSLPAARVPAQMALCATCGTCAIGSPSRL